jgi:hypothetical protein
LGYQTFAVTNNDLRAVKRALSELLEAPPEIDVAFLATLLEWAEGEQPSVSVAAGWTASLLLRSPRDKHLGTLTNELTQVYWGEVRLFRLGHATDWLTNYLRQVDGYTDPRGVRRSFVYNALDFAPHTEMLCAPLSPSTSEHEERASERVANVLDQCPMLKSGLSLGSGETSAALVARSVALFRAHEEKRRPNPAE